MIHIPGKKNNAADVASRHLGGGGPDFDWEEDDCSGRKQKGFSLKNNALISDTVAELASLSAEETANEADKLEDKARATVSSMLADFEILNFEDLSRACKLDEDASIIVDAVRNDFPNDKSAADEALKSVYHFKDKLYELDNVPMVRGRMYVPKSIRPQLLETLHSGHQGISGMKTSARNRFFFPAVKTAKKLVSDNVNSEGNLMTNNFVRALLQHRNTNLRGLNESQAQIVYGADVRDTLPRAPLKAWTKLNDDREMSRARIRHDRGEAYKVQNSNLEALKEGDTVSNCCVLFVTFCAASQIK